MLWCHGHMCGQGGVPEDCVKYRSWYMAQLTYSSLSCYVCNESSNKALSFKKNKIFKLDTRALAFNKSTHKRNVCCLFVTSKGHLKQAFTCQFSVLQFYCFGLRSSSSPLSLFGIHLPIQTYYTVTWLRTWSWREHAVSKRSQNIPLPHSHSIQHDTLR